MVTTIAPAGGLVGIQEPRIALRPATMCDFSAGESALRHAALTSNRHVPWQASGVREGMAKTAEGKWAAREVGVLASRQNGKNGIMETVELGWMIDEPGIQILHTAHKYKTAMKAMKRFVALLKSSPKLWAHVAKNGIRWANGAESIEFANGSVIAYSTRTNQGGRGESYDRIVFDEAMVLSAAAFAAIRPLLTTADQPGSTGPGGQIWFLGSAADADSQEHCGQWAALRERALDGEPRLLWLEWSAEPPPEDATREERAAWRADRRNWAQANPSLGYLITEETIEDELRGARAALEKWETERLSVGRWPRQAEEREPVVPLHIWEGMAEVNVQVRGPIAVALDMTPDLKTCAIGAATHTVDGRIRVELGYHGSPRDVLDRIVDLVARWDPCALVINSSSPAASLVPKLRALGIEPEISNFTQAADAAVGLVDDALGGRLSHGDDPRIWEALGVVETKPFGGGRFGWDYTAGEVTRVQVLSLARWGLLTFGLETVTPPQTPTQIDDDTTVIEDELMSMGF
ncbi:hypothetical protein [Nocardia sp. CA-145437]|uniref:hypothetical protein n=1 Tax=Nocardia sp. CA-145437 TaxID=3239980 RepID=UPI003D98020E